jgi:hypothetical protein
MILLLCACNEKKEKQETEQNSEPIIESKTKIKPNSKLNNDYSKSAELFAKEVLKENIRVHSFDMKNSENPRHLKIFQSNGLEKIVAYSDKNYPKKTNPINYQHFILFVATYSNNQKAETSFNQIKKDALKYEMFDNLKSLDKKDYERVIGLIIGVKPGGLITQNGKQIFSLVETCRNTPIGGTWNDYENKFLNFISKNRNEIEVLNSDCGKMGNYVIENRKKPAGNTVYN